MATQTIDNIRLERWLNARKLTPGIVAERTGIELRALSRLVSGEAAEVSSQELERLCDALEVAPDQLHVGEEAIPAVIHRRREEMEATHRAISRDGIHFYNYYSLPAPHGRIAPVILDILCPADRLPALNNGHLEPALTLNLGPGPIHGRWGEDLGPLTWQELEANDRNRADEWILGASYTEPSFCPHTYSLATETPARIVSYTAPSGLQPLVEDCDAWPDRAFAEFAEHLDRSGSAPVGLAASLARRGHDAESAAAAAGVSRSTLDAALSGEASLSSAEARALGGALGLDYRLLLPRERREDGLGKNAMSVAESAATARRFRSYEVASMAAAPHLPDIVGLFMRISKSASVEDGLDLADHGETHYLVTGGRLALHWFDDSGHRTLDDLVVDDSVWIGPYVPHSFSGEGSLVKLGHGGALGARRDLELDNTFEAAQTLRRARRDRIGWGFDEEIAR